MRSLSNPLQGDGNVVEMRINSCMVARLDQVKVDENTHNPSGYGHTVILLFERQRFDDENRDNSSGYGQRIRFLISSGSMMRTGRLSRHLQFLRPVVPFLI
jgi:hypothetical protein